MTMKKKWMRSTPTSVPIVYAPKRLDGGRTEESLLAGLAKPSVENIVTTQKPSMKTHDHSQKVIEK